MLGSINLSEFVTTNKTFDFEEFKKTVDVAVRALNDVLDEGLPLHPLQEQRDSVRDWRQIGLGIMGLADMLIKMNIRYGSKESIELCDMIGYIMAYQAIKTSSGMAANRGSYPMYNRDAVSQSAFWSEHVPPEDREVIAYTGMLNSQLLTIAPTGTLSTMLGISGGIEPIYANYYERKTESLHGHDEYYKVYTPIVKRYMEEHKVADDKELPDFFVTAQTLNYKERIDMQAIWQKHIDASISSTVNVPNSFSVEDTENLYIRAWEKGLKGVTIFRDSCKRIGILTTSTNSDSSTTSVQLNRGDIISVNDDLLSYKRTIVNGCGKFYLHLDFDEDTGDPLETWIDLGSEGGCERNLTFISRLISLSLRAGVPLKEIIEQSKSIKPCLAYTGRTKKYHDTSKGTSCPSAIGIALNELQKKIHKRCFEHDKKPPIIKKKIEQPKKEEDSHYLCPECGDELVFEGGCNTCKSCGWSKCN